VRSERLKERRTIGPVAVPTQRALAAVVAAAAERGLSVDGLRIVRDATNVLVHLEPAPVVARVPITLARLRPRAWFEQEVELARFLARAGAPVAPPSKDVDPGPDERDGLLVTFWQHVDHDPARFDASLAGRSLRDLHGALGAYEDELPTFDRLEEVGRLLATLRPSHIASEADLAALRGVHESLAAPPAEAWRPLHGDSHFNNLLWSSSGPLWTDFENACSGPIEYDLACLLWRGAAGTDEAVAAYGAHDAAIAAAVEPYLALFLAAWTIVVVERDPRPGAAAEAQRRIERATRGQR
jgi:Ser/Thr protein kinase RdoA (MazF antagonist)